MTSVLSVPRMVRMVTLDGLTSLQTVNGLVFTLGLVSLSHNRGDLAARLAVGHDGRIAE